MTRSPLVASRWLRYGVVTACAVSILVASLVDPGEAPPTTLFDVPSTVYLHVVAYAGLAWTLGYAQLSTSHRSVALAVVVATLFGAVVEALQGLVPYRTASTLDVVLNAAGATLGASVWLTVGHRFGASGSSADGSDASDSSDGSGR